MTDGLPRDAVFTELIDELAGQDIVEELIDFGGETTVRALVPGGAPEGRKNLDRGEERAIAVSEMRRSRGRSGRRFGAMQGNNTDRMFWCLRWFLLARLCGHG